MAELLVKAVDATLLSDLRSDRQGCYKRGDVVVVMPDGHRWGSREGLPNFAVIKRPGSAVGDWAYLLQEEPGTIHDAFPLALSAIRRLHPTLTRKVRNQRHRRRRYSLDIDTGVETRKPAGD